jgi:hypothetical protein
LLQAAEVGQAPGFLLAGRQPHRLEAGERLATQAGDSIRFAAVGGKRGKIRAIAILY